VLCIYTISSAPFLPFAQQFRLLAGWLAGLVFYMNNTGELF
jgi:hypothetical protein